jgi:pimeloyl-ACP methyl ester carboxylesterase
MTAAHVVLVPGFWLGAWAWDEVAAMLRDDGYAVTALTLPGLESADADRSGVTFADHVDAICSAVTAAGADGRPVVLVVHSGTGFSGYAATDRVPDKIAAMVYADSAPGKGALKAAAEDWPLPTWEDLDENLDGLTEEHLATFRERAVPEPGGVISGSAELTNDARLDVPTTIICTGFPAEQLKAAVAEGDAWLAGLTELRSVEWVDLPTSHWPMWSRPRELADVIAGVAAGVSPG